MALEYNGLRLNRFTRLASLLTLLDVPWISTGVHANLDGFLWAQARDEKSMAERKTDSVLMGAGAAEPGLVRQP